MTLAAKSCYSAQDIWGQMFCCSVCVCVCFSFFLGGSVAFLFVLSCCSPDSANDFETIRCAANGQ